VIAGGLATPALLGHVLISKHCDHTPPYQQSQIFSRHDVDLCRSTLAGLVGGACWWREALQTGAACIHRLCAGARHPSFAPFGESFLVLLFACRRDRERRAA
jgi:hypothetical protein